MSFTGYLAFCLSRAVDEERSVQAYLKGRKQLVIFDDVDIGLPVQRQIEGTCAPMSYVIRRANHKTFQEINQEIRKVQSQPVPPNKGIPNWLGFFMLLPWPFPMLFIALFRAMSRRDPANPWGVAAIKGTVGITAVGMFGHSTVGWGLTPGVHSIDLVVGGIQRKPAMVEDRIEPREMLNLTVALIMM